MNGKNLCYNCFQEKHQLDGPCPYCGFDLAENQEKFPMALKAGTVLNSRYTVGRVLGQGGFGITYVAWDECGGEGVHARRAGRPYGRKNAHGDDRRKKR